jgi:hypothetical protein
MVWGKTLGLVMSAGLVAAQEGEDGAPVVEPKSPWGGHHHLPIEYNSSKTVVLNAVADGRLLRGTEDFDGEDDLEFKSGTMNEFVGHVFMSMCDADGIIPGNYLASRALYPYCPLYANKGERDFARGGRESKQKESKQKRA